MTLSSAVYSGICAALASLFGKLSGLDFEVLSDYRLKYGVKITCFCLMLLLNSLVWTFFVKALQKSKNSVEATAISTASNYILSGLLGFFVFGEVTGLLWWFGVSLVFVGILIINRSDSDVKTS